MYVGRNNLLNRCLITWEHNVLRWVELILCLVCLLLSILMFYKRVFITTKIVHVAVDAAFVFILATDVISWCLKTPITIKTWMIISMSGFLMYCFNAGLLLFLKTSSSTGLITFNIAANIITAVVFLFDCLWVCWEYIHADYRTVIDVDLRVIPGGTCPRIKSITSVRSGNHVDRAVSTCFLLEINEFECPVVRKRKGNLVYPAMRPMRPMSYGGTFPVDKDLAPLSSGGCYRRITSVSGVGVSPSQQSRSRKSVRLASASPRTTGGDTRRSTMDPGQEYYYDTTPEGCCKFYPADMGDADTVPEREYMNELPPVTSTTTTQTSIRSISPSQRRAVRSASPCSRANGLDDNRSAFSQRRTQDATSYRSQFTGYSIDTSQQASVAGPSSTGTRHFTQDPYRTSAVTERTGANRQSSQGRYIDSIAEEDLP